MAKLWLLATLFDVDVRIATPDVLSAADRGARHGHLRALGLKVVEVRSEGVAYVAELVGRYPRTRASRSDLFAIALARQQRCALLTRDAGLRTIAEEDGIEVHGTLWLVERMFDAGLFNRASEQDSYARMRQKGRHLPWNEVAAQLTWFGR